MNTNNYESKNLFGNIERDYSFLDEYEKYVIKTISYRDI